VHRADFSEHFHRRCFVESTFSMITAKVGTASRSKTEVAQLNELPGKVLCHNQCGVIQSACELGIKPSIGGDA
jgi:hypothetical protein